MFLILVLLITALTALIPLLAQKANQRFTNIKLHESYSWLPVVAGLLFFTAFLIPDIHISNETSTFQQHFVGGGIYTACLYVYFKKLFGWRLPLVRALLVLFAWTSAIGVANELLEFTLTKLHLAHIGTGDTDWDLLANTIGALFGYALLCIFKIESRD